MLFCKECGTKLKEGAAFCNACGTAVQLKEERKVNPQQQVIPPQKMTKKKKGMLIGIGAAAVLLFGGYKIGETLTDKDRMIEKFEEALIDGDSAKIADLLHTDDPQLKINKTNVKGFVDYYKQHPNKVSSLIDTLKEQSQYLDKEEGSSQKVFNEFFGEDTLSNGVVNLEKKGKTAVLFEKFILDIEPVYLTVNTNYKDTELSLDGSKLDTANKNNFEKTYGPYLPGVYSVEAKLKTDFVDLTKKEEISLINTGSEANINLDLDGEDVTLNMDAFPSNMDAALFIGGKDVKINPLKESTFGPVLTDGSMSLQVEVEVPWGKVKTEEIPITSSNVEVNLGKNADLQKGIFNQVVSYTKEVLEAFEAESAEKLTNVTTTYRQEMQEAINEFNDGEQSYQGKYLSSAFDVDSLNVYYSDGQWLAEVEVLQTYLEDYYYKGDSPELSEVETNRVYSLVYDEKQKKWLINNMEDSYGYDSDNVKEIKEEKPKLYQINEGESEAAASTEVDTETISDYVKSYMYASVSAINEEDFSLVEDYLDPNGKKYKEQKEYTAYLNEKNITEELLNTEIKEVKKLDDSTYQVTSYDQYKIIYKNGEEKLSNFNTVQKVKVLSDGSLAMNELISTEEVD